jgi:hypothetical protein
MNWTFSSMPRTYNCLVTLRAPRPIHDRATFHIAVNVLDALAGFVPKRNWDDFLEIAAKAAVERGLRN